MDSISGDITYPLAETSLTYLKSENHPGIFCLITPELNTIELNFLQAVKLFKADETEKAISLIPNHHEQVMKGMDFFKSQKNQDSIRSVSRKNLSPAENKAITNLNFALKHAPTEQKRMALQRALEIIRKGTYASKGLPKSINDFFKINSNLLSEPIMFIEKLFLNELDKYDLSPNADLETSQDDMNAGIINPKIVLTESFSS